jgi:hypothetical protein
MTAVEEDAHLIAVAPDGRATQFPAAAREHLTELVRRAIEPPSLFAVSASSAATLLYGVVTYSVPSIISGVASNCPGTVSYSFSGVSSASTATPVAAASRCRH